MSNELTDEQLIELAKKAKPVPVPIDGKKPKKAPKVLGEPFFNFMKAINLRGGKFEVSSEDIYDAYCQWTTNPMSIEDFRKELRRFFKVVNKKYKINMREFTLLERVKELQNENKT